MPNQTRRRIRNTLLLIIPFLVLLQVSLYLTLQWKFGAELNNDLWQRHVILFIFPHLIWIGSFYGFRLFDLLSYQHFWDVLQRIILASLISIVGSISFIYFQPELLLTPRRFLLLHSFLISAPFFFWYLLMAKQNKTRNVNSIYFLELTQEFQSTIALLKQHPTNIHKITQLSFNDLKANASQIESATLPLVILPNTLTSEQQNTLNQLHNKGVQFQSFGAFYEEQFRRIPEISLSNRWLLENIQHRHPAGFLFTKRVVDLSCGILMGLVFLITFPFIASLIKLTSSGPILFSQKRRSTRNHDISIAKFRTMKHGTKDDIWTQPNDPRITRIGHILRTTHLDELPQCWNLITGTLSLVGPRPEQSHIVDALQTKIPFYQTRHTVKPGITGWAQLHVYAGSVEETKEKLEYDLYYLKHKSILFDTEIIIKTLFSLMGIKS